MQNISNIQQNTQNQNMRQNVQNMTDNRQHVGGVQKASASTDIGTSEDVSLLQKRAEELRVKYIGHFDPKDFDKKLLALVPVDTAKKYRVVPFGTGEGNLVKIAMEDPQDIEALNVLRFLARKENIKFEIYLADRKLISSFLSQYESTEQVLRSAVETIKTSMEEEVGYGSDIEIFDSIKDAPVAKLVEIIIGHALTGKASDIHIEPIEKEYRVRFRVDGVLHSSLSLPNDVGRAVVARIKILSNLKIDEKRKPQDGRFRLSDKLRSIDFRVSTLPVVEGEKVVMRVLDRESVLVQLEDLGVLGRNLEVFKRRIRDPFGIVLITGPTGSGKSTTLYAFLRILNAETTNIVTLEDPVEYFMDGINQSQINPRIGYTFASGLRSILRQDPNVIMVGEVRDSETAELAIHAALTGHLVFSTLHTNSAIGAIPRLVDMGLQPFLMSASMRAIAAQRLMRRICTECKQEERLPEELYQRVKEDLASVSEKEFEKYGLIKGDKMKFYKSVGCEKCGQTGYKGRVAIYEVFEITEAVQDIISKSTGNVESEIERETKLQGMTTLRQDALLKVLKGLSSMAEVQRITEGKMDVGGDMEDSDLGEDDFETPQENQPTSSPQPPETQDDVRLM